MLLLLLLLEPPVEMATTSPSSSMQCGSSVPTGHARSCAMDEGALRILGENTKGGAWERKPDAKKGCISQPPLGATRAQVKFSRQDIHVKRALRRPMMRSISLFERKGLIFFSTVMSSSRLTYPVWPESHFLKSSLSLPSTLSSAKPCPTPGMDAAVAIFLMPECVGRISLR